MDFLTGERENRRVGYSFRRENGRTGDSGTLFDGRTGEQEGQVAFLPDSPVLPFSRQKINSSTVKKIFSFLGDRNGTLL